MTSFPIPDRYRDAFEPLVDLTDSAAQTLVQAVEDVGLALPEPEAVAQSVRTRVPELAPYATQLVYGLMLLVTRASDKERAQRIAVDVAGDLGASAESGFAHLLTRLLHADRIRLMAKAYSLSAEYADLYHNVRVLADFRPIFPEGSIGPPVAAVIMNQMRVSYYDSEREKTSIYLALTESELHDFRSEIDRALEKNASLRAFLESVNLEYLKEMRETDEKS